MQPYAFPYIGYFKLISSSDCFVFLDNVSYIKKGFINRNSVMLNNVAHRFTIPVSKQSQNRFINEHEYTGDFDKFLRLIYNSYHKCKNFSSVFELLTSICSFPDLNVAQWNANSIVAISKYIGLSTRFQFSSEINACLDKVGQERIICICKSFNAHQYINLPGGRTLYQKSDFESEKIQLFFLDTTKLLSSSIHGYSVSNLSIIDILMHCDTADVHDVLHYS